MVEEEKGEFDSTDAAYERQVRTELATRKARLATLEEHLARIEFQLKQMRPEKLMLKGSARDVAQSEVYRKALRVKQGLLLKERKEAQEDFERAEERLRSIVE